MFVSALSLILGLVALRFLILYVDRVLNPPFKNIPGPPSKSFTGGACSWWRDRFADIHELLVGHFQLIHSKDVLHIHEQWWRDYGRVFRVAGLYGVSEHFDSIRNTN
jgi:hypothetical protein